MGLVAAGAALVAVAACGDGEGSSGAAWVSPEASAAPPSPAKPDRLAKITSACELLPAGTVKKVLGSSSRTTLEARELPVDKSDGEVAYGCAYGKDGQEPFALNVSTSPGKASAARTTVDNIGTASGAETTALKGVGTAGVAYVKDAFRIVVVAVPYEVDLRLVVFAAPEIVPQQKLVELTETVVAKI